MGVQKAPFVVFVSALGVRLAHLRGIHGSPFFAADRPPSDAFLYRSAAEALAHGDLGCGPSGAFVTSPPYVLFLALVRWIAGPSALAPLVVQAVMGALTAALITHLGQKLFGRREGLFAGLLAALYELFVFYDGELLKTTLGLFCLVLLLVLLTASPPRLSAQRLFGAGVLLGLAQLATSSLALFTVVACGWVVWRSKRALPVVAFGVGLGISMVPYALRDRIAAPGRAPFAHGEGIHLYIGQQPGANGSYTPVAGVRPTAEGHVVDAAVVAERALQRPLTGAEVSRYFRDRAVKVVLADPLGAVTIALRKARLFANAYEIPNNEDLYWTRAFSPVLRAPLVGYGLLFPLAVFGAGLGLKRRETWLVAALPLLVFLAMLLTFVTARYRIAAAPGLILFAGRALGFLWVKAKAWALRPPLVPSLCGVLALGLSQGRAPLPNELTFERAAAHALGDPAAARCGLEAPAVAEAKAAMNAGDYTRALGLVERVRAGRAPCAEAFVIAARALERLGRIDEAIDVLTTMPATGPGGADVAREIRRLRKARGEQQAPSINIDR